MKSVILKGSEKAIKTLLEKERYWLKRNKVEIANSVDSKSNDKELKKQIDTLESDKKELKEVNGLLQKQIDKLKKNNKKS